MEDEKFQLKPAEVALLKFWRSYVPCDSPQRRRYDSNNHTIANRTMLYYFMTEDLIEYFKLNKVPDFTGKALGLMHVQSSTLSVWRKKWGHTWRNLQLF